MDFHWLGTTSGNYSDPTNWLENAVPGPNDNAIFDMNAAGWVQPCTSNTPLYDTSILGSPEVALDAENYDGSLDWTDVYGDYSWSVATGVPTLSATGDNVGLNGYPTIRFSSGTRDGFAYGGPSISVVDFIAVAVVRTWGQANWITGTQLDPDLGEQDFRLLTVTQGGSSSPSDNYAIQFFNSDTSGSPALYSDPLDPLQSSFSVLSVQSEGSVLSFYRNGKPIGTMTYENGTQQFDTIGNNAAGVYSDGDLAAIRFYTSAYDPSRIGAEQFLAAKYGLPMAVGTVTVNDGSTLGFLQPTLAADQLLQGVYVDGVVGTLSQSSGGGVVGGRLSLGL